MLELLDLGHNAIVMGAVTIGVIVSCFACRGMDWDVHEMPVSCLWMLLPNFIGPRRHVSESGNVLDSKEGADLMYRLGLKKLFGDFSNDPMSFVAPRESLYRRRNKHNYKCE